MARFDFTGESDDKYPIADVGEQIVKVENVSEETSKSGNPMWLFKLRSNNGGLLYHYCLNLPKKRWMLKKTIEAITGQKQPSGEVTINLDNLIDEKLRVNIIHEDYAGIKRAKVADVLVGDLVAPEMASDIYSGKESFSNKLPSGDFTDTDQNQQESFPDTLDKVPF